MVSRNTTLVPFLGLRIGLACEAGLSAGMQRERVPPRIRKKKEGPQFYDAAAAWIVLQSEWDKCPWDLSSLFWGNIFSHVFLYVNFRPEERFFFIYDDCLLQDQDDDITKSVLYFDPKFVSCPTSVGVLMLFFFLQSLWKFKV